MERRSTRGRQSVDASPAPTPAAPAAPAAAPAPPPPAPAPAPPPLIEPLPALVAPEAVPEIGVEEVVLNRRGMPARQRKKNKFYFDDDIMITTDTPRKSLSKSPVKKIKLEPPEETKESHESTPVKSKAAASPATKANKAETSKASKVDTPKPSTSESAKARVDTTTKIKNTQAASKTPTSAKATAGTKTPTSKAPSAAKASTTPKSSAAAKSATVSKASTSKTPATPRGKKDKDAATTSKTSKADKDADHSHKATTPSKSKASQSSPAKAPQPIKIKKDPDATPKSAGKAEKDRDKERQEKQRDKEKAKEKDRPVKEKEKKDVRRDKHDRQKERDVAVPAKRNRRGSSPSQYLVNRAITPELSSMDLPKPAIDKKTAQEISLRLRNVLKLPKAHKWVCYEWFYSNIDKVLFEGENDFQICLKESFPTLKARKCTRVEWCKVRRMMGKPRRCSQAFFDEEREELARRRQKIRMIQQRKITDFNYKELPDEIPLQLVIGTKVTARLRRPQDGLFTGTIEGVDTSNNTYRITFDRSGLGTHSIPDYEVLSNDNPETVSTSSFALKIPRRSYGGFTGANFKFNNAALMGEDGAPGGMPKSPFPVDGMLGGFPIRLLDMIVRLSKLLKAKREKILQLKELNVEAEKMYSYSKVVNNDYRMRYARCVLDLDSMNKEMAMYLEGIQQYCLDIAPDHGSNQMIIPEHVQEQCRQEALLIVDTYNTKQNRNLLHNAKNLSLISQLTSLLLQIKTLGTGERNLYELKSIKDTVKEVKASLEGRNVVLFQNRVEIPVNQIQAGLCGSSYPAKGAF